LPTWFGTTWIIVNQQGAMMERAGENPILPSEWKNSISSVRVPRGCSLQVWRGADYTGETHEYGSGDSNTIMNDAISSFKVKNFECTITLYQGKNFSGKSFTYKTSQAFGGKLGWNSPYSAIRSMKITPGCSAMFYGCEKFRCSKELVRHDFRSRSIEPNSFKLIFDRENFCPTIKELLALPVKERYQTWDKGCDVDIHDDNTCRMPTPPKGYSCSNGPDDVGINNYPCCTKPRWQVLELEGSYQPEWETKLISLN
jgi:hypothetical protein